MDTSTEDNGTIKFPNTAYDLIVIGASAGGLKALIEVLSVLPADFPAAIAVVQHMAPQYRSQMAEILARRTPLKSTQAGEGDILAPAHIYFAPPDYHLMIKSGGIVFLSHTAIVNYVRPSVNNLFSSAAGVFKDRLIGVILTGTGSDGAVGVESINANGGKVIVQDEATSEYFSMPSAAINTGTVEFVLPLEAIAPMLCSLVMVDER
jgi:two-component system chemotaxis response regulator CheB